MDTTCCSYVLLFGVVAAVVVVMMVASGEFDGRGGASPAPSWSPTLAPSWSPTPAPTRGSLRFVMPKISKHVIEKA